MTEFKMVVPIVKAEHFFSLAPQGFMLSAPLPDGTIQVTFCDDFAIHPHLAVSGDMHEDGYVVTSSVDFAGENERLAYGRIKLSLERARELRDLLTSQIEMVEGMPVPPEGKE